MLNLEVKARDADPSVTLSACLRLGAVDAGSLRQRDTYFGLPAGRLKLREDLTSGTAELIHYERPVVEGVRASHYRRVEVTAAQPLRELLSAALGVVGVVEKTRRLFLYDHVRIHLDDVDGLGSFVELEAVLPEGSDVPAGDEVLDRVISALRLGERPSIGGGYLELLNAS